MPKEAIPDEVYPIPDPPETHAIPALRLEDQRLTSFSGLVVLQARFARLALKERLRACFRHLPVHSIFGQATILL